MLYKDEYKKSSSGGNGVNQLFGSLFDRSARKKLRGSVLENILNTIQRNINITRVFIKLYYGESTVFLSVLCGLPTFCGRVKIEDHLCAFIAISIIMGR